MMNMSGTFVVKKPTQTSEKDTSISAWEEQQAKNAHHRALIMRILKDYPEGLTTQKIIQLEQEYYGYTFLSDNRLRELRQKGWVKCEGEKPMKWVPILAEVEQSE